MDAAQAKSYDDALARWARQMIRELEESLSKHARFDMLYPELKDEIEVSPLPAG